MKMTGLCVHISRFPQYCQGEFYHSIVQQCVAWSGHDLRHRAGERILLCASLMRTSGPWALIQEKIRRVLSL